MQGGQVEGAVLSGSEIEVLAHEADLLDKFDPESLKGASYDLHLGTEYATDGRRKSLAPGEDLILEPGQFVLLKTTERLSLPTDLIGHAGLASHWAQQGLISLFSPQIDPGFVGYLVIPLFNGGNAPVTLACGDSMFTVEFVWMAQPAARSWADDNKPLERISDRVRISMARQDFTELEEGLRKAQSDIDTLRATYEGFSTGSGMRIAVSSLRGVWIGVFVALFALGIAAASLVVALLA